MKLFSRLLVMLVAAAAATTTGPSDAAAQHSEAEAEARALFDEGLALAGADRWAEALPAFRRSASLVSRGSTSYNIANALYRLDRPVEALAELDEYERMPEVRNDPAASQRGQTLRALIHAARGEVRLIVTPAAASLFVDGWPSVLTGPERIILLNPGAHFIRLTHQGCQPHRQELNVDRGGRQSYSIELQARPSSVVTEPSLGLNSSTVAVESAERASLPPPSPSKDDRKRFVKRPGFWVMLGVIAAAGIGVGVAVAVTRRDDSPPCGTTGDCATTQGLTASF
ncbi:MAG: hypothetical protein KJN97_14160 [Deltaproteobacteria bacterium]|nr:hypothetical protein [Deltaproteobacteria bacterium]